MAIATVPIMQDAVQVQRDYYRNTAGLYDAAHITEVGEHSFALAFMLSMIKFYHIESVLDIGSGTGRAVHSIKNSFEAIRVVGIEPCAELREIGYSKGLSEEELRDGDAQHLAFADGTFDLVCEFGALHHIPKPHMAVSEMMRVAKTAIFISDCNNFGNGGRLSRVAKQAIREVGLWKAADFIKTRGKGYSISQGDGLAYSYSVYNDYPAISKTCKSVHIMNTTPAGVNPYRSASHIALLGLKN